MIVNEDSLKDNKKNLQSYVYESEVRFHTMAMITDKNSGEEKSKGILLTAPLFKIGTKIFLKNVKLVTSLVNTCKSQTAITAVDGKIYNRKYTDELNDMFDNLQGKITTLELGKYNEENIDNVMNFLQAIKIKIGSNEDTIAGNIYESDGSGTDLPATIDRVSSGKVRTWALAFAGYKDNDTMQLITDDKKRNPVDIFFGNNISTRNSSGLKTLIGTCQLDNINKNLIDKLENKDFSKELRESSIERNFGYNYYLCYFVQALLQIVLIDNEKILTPMEHAIIKSNWDKFLRELANPDLKNMFDDYNPGAIEKRECPYKFVNFMLNKLLGKDLFKKLEINDEICKSYANGSVSISDSLSEADHANQIIAMGFNHNLDNLTYDNSLFFGQGDFVYAPLYNAYEKMDKELKQKLQLLAFELKTKKIKLDQSGYETSNEYKFGRIQEVTYEYVNDSKTGKKTKTGKVEDIKYKVPNDYDTDISVEDLMDLVLEIQSIEKDLDGKLTQAISDFKINRNANGFLDTLIKFQNANIYLNENQIQSILNSKEPSIAAAIFSVVNDSNCNNKYISAYSWFINNHPKFIGSINIDFVKLDLLSADVVYSLWNKIENKKHNDPNCVDKTTLLLILYSKNMLNKKLIRKIDADVIKKMLEQNQKLTNEIIIKFLDQFDSKFITSMDLSDDKLSENTINEIFYNKHEYLYPKQIQAINCHKLNNLSIKILFQDHLAHISQANVNTFSCITLKELTISKLAELLICKDANLDFSRHENWLRSLYLDDLYYSLTEDLIEGLIKDPVDQEQNEAKFIRFVAKHIKCFSKNQILSLSKNVFEYVSEYVVMSDPTIKTCAENVLAKLAEIENNGSELEKNIVKIMAFSKKSEGIDSMVLAMLVHIYQKSTNEIQELLSFLIENNEAFCRKTDLIVYSILHSKGNDISQKELNDEKKRTPFNFYEYERVYMNSSEQEKEQCKEPLNISGFRECFESIQKMLVDFLKTDGDKGKNINRLCLSRLPSAAFAIAEYPDLSNLLSNEQIQNIDMSNTDCHLQYLYLFLNKFGKKLKFEQFYNLVSSFNETIIYDGSPKNIDNRLTENDGKSSGLLGKIALISNFINDKEKEFQNKYSEINDEFEDILSDLNSVIISVAEEKYSNDHAEQRKYCNQYMYNRELYEKSDNTESHYNNLRADQDDERILNKLQTLKEELKTDITDITEINKLQNDDQFTNKIEEIKEKMKKFDELYYSRKNEFCKLKTNFYAALGNLDTKKVGICIRNMYSNYVNSYQNNNSLDKMLSDISLENKELWKLNPIVIKFADKEKRYTFKEFFIDGFIEAQWKKNQNGADSNFSSQQKQSMGIVNIVNKIEQKSGQNDINIKVEQYTPEYILHSLPLILEKFHCENRSLTYDMEELGLFDLTLKFEQNNKKSLERFIDSEKLKLIENTNADNADDQRINEINNINHMYFEAVKELFCIKADHIVENADLIFETENKNSNGKTANSIQQEFHSKLQALTQEIKKEKIMEQGKEVEKYIVKGCLDKKSIIKNLIGRDLDKSRVREHILFFCGDWIFCSNKFHSKGGFLTEYESIIKKRINFACQSNNPDNIIKLNDTTYNLLTAFTLLSGLVVAYEDKLLAKIGPEFINRICFLITEKNNGFLQDDAELIAAALKVVGPSQRFVVAKSIAECITKNQNYEYLSFFMKAFVKLYHLSNTEKIEFITHIFNSGDETDLIKIMEAIDKAGFYPDCNDKYNCRDDNEAKESSWYIMQKLMGHLLQKYQFGVYPDGKQKLILESFLQKFVWRNVDFSSEERKSEIFSFFKQLMQKVPLKKYKDVTKEIIRICANLRVSEQKAEILRCVLGASNDFLKSFELLEFLKQNNYMEILIEPMENSHIILDYDLIGNIISDIIQNPLLLTEGEVKLLEWFCANCERFFKYFEYSDPEKEEKEKDLRIHEANSFFSLIKKMPEGSIAASMFRNLVNHFFPSLGTNRRYYDNSDKIKSIDFVFDLFENMNDIVSYLAYVLPQNQLKEIVQLDKSKYYSIRNTGVYYNGEKYFFHLGSPDIKSDITDQYQEDMKKKFKQIEKEEAKQKEVEKGKMSGICDDSNKINENKIMVFSKSEQKNKEQEKKNDNNNVIINNITNININNVIIIDNNQSNPYTLSVCFGIIFPIIPSIIFGFKIYNKQHKITGGDIVLIIVGLIPGISAIVFGIMAYKYNQNNRYTETQESLKGAGNMDKYCINPNTNKEIQINRPGSVIGNENKTQNEH